MRVIAALLLMVFTTTAACAAEFDDLVAKAERGDADVNYAALRTSFVQSDHYAPYDSDASALAVAAYKAAEAGDCPAALAKAGDALKINYLSIVAHAVRGDCLQRQGDETGSARELAIGRGIAQALLATGDGTSPATAYIVVTISEEGFLLNVLGFPEERQALINDNGHAYDLISGHDFKTHEPRSAYFNVDALFLGMSRQFGLPAK